MNRRCLVVCSNEEPSNVRVCVSSRLRHVRSAREPPILAGRGALVIATMVCLRSTRIGESFEFPP